MVVWVGVIARRGDEVLLIRSSDGWELPTCRLMASEAPRDAAARALREAVHLHVTVDALFDVYPVEGPEPGVLLVYLGTFPDGTSVADDRIAFFPRRALPANLTHPSHAQALAAWTAASYHVAVVQPDRFCPKCGTRLVTQSVRGQALPVCPACRFVLYRDPKVGAGVLVEDEQGRVLLVRRRIDPGRGKWHIPSGFVDAGEHPEEAARRELLEETGLEISIDGLFGVYTYDDDLRGAGIWLCYRGQVVGGTLRPADDVSEVRFFAPTELPGEIAFTTTRAVLRDWMRRARQ